MSLFISDERFDVRPMAVKVTEDALSVDLEDGRTISVPLLWYPRLLNGTPKERNNFKLGAIGIHWPDLDEDISVKGLLLGNQSGESPQSLKFWLEQRALGRTPTLDDWSRERARRSKANGKTAKSTPARRSPKRKAS